MNGCAGKVGKGEKTGEVDRGDPKAREEICINTLLLVEPRFTPGYTSGQKIRSSEHGRRLCRHGTKVDADSNFEAESTLNPLNNTKDPLDRAGWKGCGLLALRSISRYAMEYGDWAGLLQSISTFPRLLSMSVFQSPPVPDNQNQRGLSYLMRPLTSTKPSTASRRVAVPLLLQLQPIEAP
jgi:hypothetical protein